MGLDMSLIGSKFLWSTDGEKVKLTGVEFA